MPSPTDLTTCRPSIADLSVNISTPSTRETNDGQETTGFSDLSVSDAAELRRGGRGSGGQGERTRSRVPADGAERGRILSRHVRTDHGASGTRSDGLPGEGACPRRFEVRRAHRAFARLYSRQS